MDQTTNDCSKKRESEQPIELDEEHYRILKRFKTISSSSSSTDSDHYDDYVGTFVHVRLSYSSSTSSSSSSASPSSSSSSSSGGDDDTDNESDDTTDSESEGHSYNYFDLYEAEYLLIHCILKDLAVEMINELVVKIRDIYHHINHYGWVSIFIRDNLIGKQQQPSKECITKNVKKQTICNYHCELQKKLKPCLSVQDSNILFDLLDY